MKEMGMQRKSIFWINALKALSILIVFFVHCQSYYGYLISAVNQFVYPWYVNAFFFVSGYLLFWKQLSEPRILENHSEYVMGGGKTLFLNILFRIVVPSIIFSIIEFVPSCLIQRRGIDLGYALYKTIGGGTYWFTSALVVAELILLLLFCMRKRNIWFYVIGSFAMGITSLLIVHFEIFHNGVWAWRQGLIALVFLALGGLYWRYEKPIDKLMKWWFIIPLLAVYVAMVILLKGYNDPLISTLKIQPLGFITSAIACLLLVWLCKALPEMKPLTFIGQNSIGFYFMSGALPISLSLITQRLLPGYSAVSLLSIWLACVFTAYIAVFVINRWLPWLWDLRKIHK